jgi:hypothetical protein
MKEFVPLIPSFEVIDEHNKEKVRTTLIGFNNAKIIIATPIKRIFDSLVNLYAGELKIDDISWWKTFYNEDVAFVLVPQGSPCLDLVLSLNKTNKYVHIGYAGLIKSDDYCEFSIGDVMYVKKAYIAPYENRYYFPGEISVDFSKQIECVSVSNFSTSLYFQKSIKKCSLIDMESALVYAAADANHINAQCIQIISDDSDSEVFSSDSIIRLNSKYQDSIREIAKYLNSMFGETHFKI